MNAREAVLQQFWRHAAEYGEVRIPCPDKRQAERMKFLVYGSVRKVKANPELDLELAQAAEDCMVTTEDEGKTVVIRSLRNVSDFLAQVAAANGVDLRKLEQAPRSMAEKEVRESEKRMLEGMVEGASMADLMRKPTVYD